MKLADPKSGAPVYSIVFPHTIVDRIDKAFGGLGLILPDYKKYNMEKVNEVCRGENFNLAQPMPGYTQ